MSVRSPPSSRHHVRIRKSIVPCSQGDSDSVLSEWCCVSGNSVSAYSMLMAARPLTRNRQFITSHYPTLKQHNPDLPILIRQAKGTPARVFARFGARCLLVLGVMSLIGAFRCRARSREECRGRGSLILGRRVKVLAAAVRRMITNTIFLRRDTAVSLIAKLLLFEVTVRMHDSGVTVFPSGTCTVSSQNSTRSMICPGAMYLRLKTIPSYMSLQLRAPELALTRRVARRFPVSGLN